jgi:camelysin-like metallo-endopeptidase
MTATTTRTRTARKVLGSLGVIGAAAAVAGMGTFGTFTDSTAPLNASVTTGTLALALTPANDTASLSINATNFVPGDSLSRSVDLKNAGTSAHSSISLISTASASNLLSTDPTNGLQLGIQSCSVSWTKNADGTYSCTGGTKTTMLPSTAAVQSNAVLPTPASLTVGGVDHLVVTLSLPTSAGNTFQGLSNSLALTFNGVQATGTAR